MNVLGFGESLAGLMSLQGSKLAERGIASAAVLLLGIINVAGVKWVIKLQFILLVILLLAGLDFMVGSFVHVKPGNCFIFLFTINQYLKRIFMQYLQRVTPFVESDCSAVV